MNRAQLVDRLLELIETAGEGHFGIGLHDDGTWAVGCAWGREAPDSPMAGAALYGTAESIDGALEEAVGGLG